VTPSHAINQIDNAPVEVLLRPDDIVLDQSSSFKARVINKVFAGTSSLYTLQLNTGSQIKAAFTSHQDYALGEEIGVRLEADHTITFPYTPH
jgi:iron(III) transport system ATP-binding protein